MSKKIVILNGSPRKNGNTAGLVKEFTKGAQEAGHTVTEFFLSGMDGHIEQAVNNKGTSQSDNKTDKCYYSDILAASLLNERKIIC